MTLFVYALVSVLMVLLPVGLAMLLRRRVRVFWILFGVGVLTFAGSQAVHLPLNDWLIRIGFLPTGLEVKGTELWKMAAILGLTAGLCEELARALGFWLLKRFRRFQDSLMMGIGHGGIEAMVIGGVMLAATLSSLVPLRGVDLQTLNLPPDQLAHLQRQMQIFEASPVNGLLPLIERILAMGIHISLSVMVWKAFQKRNAWYVVAAILAHAVFDMAAVIMAYRLQNIWLIEGILALLLLPFLAFLVWNWRKEAPPKPANGKTLKELSLFIIALRKELRYQWATKRTLIILVIFSLFGISSPPLAYFMPEIIGSISGAAMFAELIPEPSVTDAIGQYVKNLTQFGFILVVFLGMAAVVNEKERGTAPMILSKPMPRWAFLLSKFSAQVLIYIAALLIACLGGYYYTWYLFGNVAFGEFLLLNLLMFGWLLPFIAMTLLGSTLGNSTASAGGIGFGLCVLLMLAQYLPKVGQLAPGGLITWAGQLGAGAAVAPNGGALLMSLVVTILAVIVSLGVFEMQEL